MTIHSKWIENNQSNSIYYQNLLKELAQSKNGSNGKDLSKPNSIYENGFIRYPTKIYETIEKNSRQFSSAEKTLIGYFHKICFSYKTDKVWYKPKKIQEDCDLPEKSFYRAIKELQNKNMILITNLTKKEGKKFKIYTKQAVFVNLYYDTWNIKYKTIKVDVKEEETLQEKMNDENEKILSLLDEA